MSGAPGHTQWRVAASTLSACCIPKSAALDAAAICLTAVLASSTAGQLRLSEGVPAGSARLELEVAALELALGGKVLQRDMVVQHLQFWAVLQHINNTRWKLIREDPSRAHMVACSCLVLITSSSRAAGVHGRLTCWKADLRAYSMAHRSTSRLLTCHRQSAPPSGSPAEAGGTHCCTQNTVVFSEQRQAMSPGHGAVYQNLAHRQRASQVR